MGVVRNLVKGLDMVMVDMLEMEMVVDQKETAMRSAARREKIEQMWLQKGLENQWKDASHDNDGETNVAADKLVDKDC